MDHDTAEFAVDSIRYWWKRMGQPCYPEAKELLITADSGGSNSYRAKLWKCQLQKLANETSLSISVCTFLLEPVSGTKSSIACFAILLPTGGDAPGKVVRWS